MTIHDTLKARNATHGDFRENARISQGLKSFITNCPGYVNLSDVERESLDLFCTKLSRILSGGNSNPDNYHDIAGYATLAEGSLKPEPLTEVQKSIREGTFKVASEVPSELEKIVREASEAYDAVRH